MDPDGVGAAYSRNLDPGAREFRPTPIPLPQFYLAFPPPPLPPFSYVTPAQAAPDAAATRAVVLSMVPPASSEADLLAALEPFGAIRKLDMASLLEEGVVTAHFFDLRSAQAAVSEIRDQHLRQQCRLGQHYGVLPPAGVFLVPDGRGLVAGQAVWAHFAASDTDGANQGTVVVLNADPSVPADAFRKLFEAFGAVREMRETAPRPQHKFIEFFDIRSAAHALSELKGKEVFGRRLVIEFSKPGNQTRISTHGGSGGGGYNRRNSGFQNLPVPPRLQPSRWGHGKHGGGPANQQPQSHVAGASGSSSATVAARNTNTTNVGGSSSSSGASGSGRRGKGGGRHQSSPGSLKKGHGRGSGWKGPHSLKTPSGGESRFLFKETSSLSLSSSSSSSAPPSAATAASNSSSSRDSRTTVMIKNIPNKYSQKLLLNMLDNHCIHCNERVKEGEDELPLSAYDFVYLPIDFNNKCNVGYGFVNLTSPEAAWRLYRAFHMQPWEVFNSRKICQVTYARLQGLEALKDHFKNSKFACDNEEYMPVVFSPPRDGKQLTEPLPIGVSIGRRRGALPSTAGEAEGEAAASSTTTSTQAPSDHEGEDALAEAMLNLPPCGEEEQQQ